MVLASLLTIPALLLAQGHPGEPWQTIGAVADWAIWLIFLFELVVMLALVRSRGAWLRAHPLDVAIVVLTPPFLFAALQSIRVLRVLRLLRLFRFAPTARRIFTLEGLRYASLIAVLVLIVGAEAFASSEGHTIGDSLYWGIATMTTVGYGDLIPHHTTGKVIACVLMLVGIGLVAIVTGAIAQRFLATEVAEVEQAVAAVEETDVSLLRELREISRRLADVEAAVQRRLQGRGVD